VSTILSKICASFRKPAQPSLLLCHLSGRNSHSSSDAATACSREAFHGERIGGGQKGGGEDLRGANVELNRLGNAGQLKEVVQMLDLMEHRGIRAYKRTYSTLLQVSALLWIWTSNHKI
jgi:pentatricopeptide repeat protein